MVILFPDICGRTKMSAGMRPPEVVEVLNGFFDINVPHF